MRHIVSARHPSRDPVLDDPGRVGSFGHQRRASGRERFENRVGQSFPERCQDGEVRGVQEGFGLVGLGQLRDDASQAVAADRLIELGLDLIAFVLARNEHPDAAWQFLSAFEFPQGQGQQVRRLLFCDAAQHGDNAGGVWGEASPQTGIWVAAKALAIEAVWDADQLAGGDAAVLPELAFEVRAVADHALGESVLDPLVEELSRLVFGPHRGHQAQAGGHQGAAESGDMIAVVADGMEKRGAHAPDRGDEPGPTRQQARGGPADVEDAPRNVRAIEMRCKMQAGAVGLAVQADEAGGEAF